MGFVYDLEMLKMIQSVWSDMSCSHTVMIPEGISIERLNEMVKHYAPHLKSLCLMPRNNKTYPQMPIESISEEKYNEMVGKIKNDEIIDNGILPPCFACDSEKCMMYNI